MRAIFIGLRYRMTACQNITMIPNALARLRTRIRVTAVTILVFAPLLSPAVPVSHPSPPLVVPNDNRAPAGRLEAGVLELFLVAREVAWQPERDPGRTITVLAFAEEDKAPQIPGPLIRVPQGTDLRISIRNSIDPDAHVGLPPVRQRVEGTSSIAGAELTVRGLLAGTQPDDTLHIPTGETRTVRFRADRPGTYLYWGALSRRSIEYRTGTDSQLTGAIIVDPAGESYDPEERIFVITMLDAFPDPAKTPPGDDLFKPVINGLSWPHTERLHYVRNRTVNWRWINGTQSEHPMHLHGFHFRTLARGDGRSENIFPESAVQDSVTELMEAGSTLRIAWTPTRAGNWLMHCHLLDHVTPFPQRLPEDRVHDLHDVEKHALTAMAGLVLGITVTDDDGPAKEPEADQRLRLIARERSIRGSEVVLRGFVVEEGTTSSGDQPSVPGPPLILTRGRTTTIEVANEMSEATTVHWHGMEIESVYDGVAGWSRTGTRVAPLVGPDSSFRVQMTPPRAGTYIYHTHMDETDQLIGGLYGPLIVLEPGQAFQPEFDRIYTVGGAVDEGKYQVVTINGRQQPLSQEFRTGTRYRLRFINITRDATVSLRLTQDEALQKWKAIANDGATLPVALRSEGPARIRFSAGETYDFEWIPETPGAAALELEWQFPTEPGSLILRQPIRVRGE
jgi:FtsP/CotA-like multicopper oxidase with cupredoxin domain